MRSKLDVDPAEEVLDLVRPYVLRMFGVKEDTVYVLVGFRYENNTYEEIVGRTFSATAIDPDGSDHPFDLEEVAAKILRVVASYNDVRAIEHAGLTRTEASHSAAAIREGVVVVCVGFTRIPGELLADIVLAHCRAVMKDRTALRELQEEVVA